MKKQSLSMELKMSKGSKQRPCNKDKFNESFDRIFGNESELSQYTYNSRLSGYIAGKIASRLGDADGDVVSMKDIRKVKNEIFMGNSK